jgi:hypothetical protein
MSTLVGISQTRLPLGSTKLTGKRAQRDDTLCPPAREESPSWLSGAPVSGGCVDSAVVGVCGRGVVERMSRSSLKSACEGEPETVEVESSDDSICDVCCAWRHAEQRSGIAMLGMSLVWRMCICILLLVAHGLRTACGEAGCPLRETVEARCWSR